MTTSSKDIDEFWTWFKQIASSLEKSPVDDTLIYLVESRIKLLGPLVWELGPGRAARKSFTISPNGDVEMLPFTRKIVASAPHLPSWEFHSSKQPRELTSELQIKDKKTRRTATLDPTRWRYILYQYEDGTFEIVVEAPDLFEVATSNRRYRALHIVLDGLLGEEARLALISGEELVPSLPQEEEERASDMVHLRDHLSTLSASH